MGLAMVGVSHHDVPLALLEAIDRGTATLAAQAANCPGIRGVVLLSTCNRVEAYLDVHDSSDADAAAEVAALMAATAPEAELPTPRFGGDVAAHLFSVAAGLESMVLGEDEIAGQVRRAVDRARAHRTASPALERLFRSAATSAKRVSSTTGLGAAGRSIVSVGLDLVEAGDGPVAGRTALLIGTGAFARVAHASLLKRGCAELMVYSSTGRARRFIDSHGGTVVPRNGLAEAVWRADVVVTCSGVQHAILDRPMLAPGTAHRQVPLPVLDLALTRDVDDDARGLPSVHVIDLDVIAHHAPQEHGDALARAHRIVAEAVAEHAVRESEREADAVVVALRTRVEQLMESESARVRRRLDPQSADAADAALRRFGGELMHRLGMRARELAREGRSDELTQALRTLADPRP